MRCGSSTRCSRLESTSLCTRRCTPSTRSDVLEGDDERRAFAEFETKVTQGVDARYELTTLFYDLQNIFTLFAVGGTSREKLVRTLQGNLYMPETLERARELIKDMHDSYEKIMANPDNLLRPGTITRLRMAFEARWRGPPLGVERRTIASEDVPTPAGGEAKSVGGRFIDELGGRPEGRVDRGGGYGAEPYVDCGMEHTRTDG